MEYVGSIWIVVSIIGLLVSNKIVFDLTIIIGNVMDMYVLGLMCIVVVGWMYMCSVGWVWMGYMCVGGVLGVDVFMGGLCMIESFAYIFQSLTLSNRISINMVAGCLFSYLVGLSVEYGICSVGVCGYESMNMVFQYGIYIFLVVGLVCW